LQLYTRARVNKETNSRTSTKPNQEASRAMLRREERQQTIAVLIEERESLLEREPLLARQPFHADATVRP